MIHPKQLLLCTTFMLGSCVPLTPQPPSIVIYNTIEAKADHEKPRRLVVTCQSGGTYIIPDKPTLDDLQDDDDQGVVDRLNEHIDFLRDELKTLAAKGKCSE
ncbi:hypothetical protein D3C85_190060 [compost metagenome]